MGKELPLARSEEEGRSVLLAISSSRELITTPSTGDQRTEEPTPAKGSNGGEAKDTKAKSKGSRKVKGVNARPPRPARRKRDNQDRESDRGDEGEDNPRRRSAQDLGVTFPGSYCDELETAPHYWVEIDKIDHGSLSQCKFCRGHLWLPLTNTDAERLGNLIRQYGGDEGYCRYLNRFRAAKVLMAKLQDLRRLETEAGDKREFARLTDKILSDKEYDRRRR